MRAILRPGRRVISLVMGGLLAGTTSGVLATSPLPGYADVRAAWQASSARVVAGDETPLARVRIDFEIRRGDWIPLSRISAALQHAVIRSEDQRFYRHGGVDWEAGAAAAWHRLWGEPYGGASTLSMQLVGLLSAEFARPAGGRSLVDKWRQIRAAQTLERTWTKPQILEAYLNEVPFRGEIKGVDALARVLFRKQAHGLDLQESALAAAMLRAPNASVRTLVSRACGVLRALGQEARCAGLDMKAQVALARTRGPRFDIPDLAPHWARRVLRAPDLQGGNLVRTTINAELQQQALRMVRRHLLALRSSGVTDAAVLVLDNRSGDVLAYVGGSGNLSSAPAVDHVQALRQAGSTLKPFLYAMALGQERLTAASLLEDSPLDIAAGSGLYIPDNYDHQFSGWVSVRTALAASLNIPAVRTLMAVGPLDFARRLQALGLPLQHGGDYYGYSLALGSADVSLYTLTKAYRVLANEGRDADVAQAPGSAHFSSAAAWIVGDILSDPQARTRTFGLDSPLNTRFWSAVKTGTSRDMRDNWCVGWSADYTVGVWVGNSQGASMRDVSGVTGAGPIWHDVLSWLHRNHPSTQPSRPRAVQRMRVTFGAALEPSREEFFIGDTGQPVFAPDDAGSSAGYSQIVQPVSGTTIALDPDIPAANQQLLLSAQDPLSRRPVAGTWLVDGAPVGYGADVYWSPRPGRHRIEWRAGQTPGVGATPDVVHIEVRG